MTINHTAIVEDSSGAFFAVRGDDKYSHAWVGVRMKRTKAGYVPVAGKQHVVLVRIAGCRIIEGAV